MNENLRLVLRLHKDGYLNEDEAVSLIQGLTVKKNEKNESFSSYADPIDLSGYKYGNLTTSSTNCSTTLPLTNTLSSNTYSSKAASTCGSTAISSVDKCTASSSSGTITSTSTSASDSWKKKFAGLISKIGNR